MKHLAWPTVLLCVVLVGCGGSDGFDIVDEVDDSAAADGVADTGTDDSTVDTTMDDTTPVDSGDDTTTSDTADTTVADTTLVDTLVADTASLDTSVADTTVTDTTVADTSVDTSVPDTSGDTTGDAGCTAGSTQSCYGGAPSELTVANTACRAGVRSCVGGVFGPCIGEVRPSPESCNGVDDDCNGTVDDGLGNVSCGSGACAKTVAACTGGVPTTCTPGAPTTEACGNSIDDDCDGVVDNGCGCVAVAPSGTDNVTCGTSAAPCRTIQYAINKAGTGTWPKQVCVGGNAGCAGAASTATYNESPKMKDGVSVLGSYNPLSTGFVRTNNCGTRIQTVDASGVLFDATIVTPTTLDGFNVVGHNDPTNAAITITGSTGAIIDGCSVDGGSGTNSVGILVQDSAGTKATPRIQNSAITGGTGSSSAIGIRSVKSAPTISRNCDTFDAQGRCTNWGCFGTNRFVRGRANGSTGGSASTTYAIRLEDSPGTTIDSSAVCSSAGQGDVAGIRLSGDATGTLIRTSYVVAPGGNTGNVNAVGIWADACAGAAPWILSNYAIVASSRTVGGRADGVRAVGNCDPRIDSNRQIVGGEESANNDAIGVYCALDATSAIASKCTILNNESILGSTAGFPPTSTGVKCDAGACARIERNLLISGAQGNNTFGLVLNGASTFVDRNNITAGCARAEGIGVYSIGALARLQNNLIVGGTSCTGGAPTSTYGLRAILGAGLGEIDVHSNTIHAGGASGSCTSRGVGLDTGPTSVSAPRGIFRNDIIHAGICATAYAVIESSSGADPRVFENNDLWIATGTGVLYRDEGTTNITTIAGVNGLTDMTSAKNISADPLFFSATNLHIQGTSPCRNAGTAASAPGLDYDGDSRPQETAHDIGYDEFKP